MQTGEMDYLKRVDLLLEENREFKAGNSVLIKVLRELRQGNNPVVKQVVGRG